MEDHQVQNNESNDMVKLVECKFLASYLLKGLNAFLINITINYSMKFTKNHLILTAKEGNQKYLAQQKIPAKVVNIEWFVPEKELEITMLGGEIKDIVSSAGKFDPIIFTVSKSPNSNSYMLTIDTSNNNLEAGRSFPVEGHGIVSNIDFNEPNMRTPRIFVDSTNFSKAMSNFKKKEMTFLVGQSGMVITADTKGKVGKQKVIIGDISNEEFDLQKSTDDEKELSELFDIAIPGSCNERLKSMSKIYKSPILIYYEPGKTLVFEMFLSYLGPLRHYIAV